MPGIILLMTFIVGIGLGVAYRNARIAGKIWLESKDGGAGCWITYEIMQKYIGSDLLPFDEARFLGGLTKFKEVYYGKVEKVVSLHFPVAGRNMHHSRFGGYTAS